MRLEGFVVRLAAGRIAQGFISHIQSLRASEGIRGGGIEIRMRCLCEEPISGSNLLLGGIVVQAEPRVVICR